MRTVQVTLVIHTEIEICDDLSDEVMTFHIEENHCNQNYIDKLQSSFKEGTCNLCSHSEAFVGHIPFENIRKLK